jgi:hypothetical protein
MDPHWRAIRRRGLGVDLPRSPHQIDVVQVREPDEAFMTSPYFTPPAARPAKASMMATAPA